MVIPCDCGRLMKNLGNVSGLVMTSNPLQWDEVWVCDDCKTKKTVRVTAASRPVAPDLSGFREL
jgi:hypothetical protein